MTRTDVFYNIHYSEHEVTKYILSVSFILLTVTLHEQENTALQLASRL